MFALCYQVTLVNTTDGALEVRMMMRLASVCRVTLHSCLLASSGAMVAQLVGGRQEENFQLTQMSSSMFSDLRRKHKESNSGSFIC